MITKYRLDIIAVTLATISILISAIQFYWSDLREERDLKAVIINYSDSRKKDAAIAEVVFINNGNRGEIVAGADFVFDTGSDEKFKALRPSEDWNWIPTDPVYLKPGSTAVRTYHMQLPKDFFNGKETKLEHWPTSIKFARSGMEFLVIDPDGSVRTVLFIDGHGTSGPDGVTIRVAGNPVIQLAKK